jgi:hypothetical protein
MKVLLEQNVPLISQRHVFVSWFTTRQRLYDYVLLKNMDSIDKRHHGHDRQDRDVHLCGDVVMG